jgi:hypothetical protein
MSTPLYPFYEPAELLGEGALDLQDLARHCQRNTAWVVERVQTGVLYCENEPSGEAAAPQAQWRFSSQTLVRAPHSPSGAQLRCRPSAGRADGGPDRGSADAAPQAPGTAALRTPPQKQKPS